MVWGKGEIPRAAPAWQLQLGFTYDTPAEARIWAAPEVPAGPPYRGNTTRVVML